MTRELEVKLDKPSGIYVPGELVSGQLIIRLEKLMTVTAIALRFKGKCRVWWKQGKSNRSACEVYFEEYVLLSHYTDGQEFELTSGRHVYPFAFTLPQNIPSSFQHNNGLIRYSLKAALKQSWKFDLTTKFTFTVVNSFDFFSHSHLWGAIDDESIEQFNCIIPCVNSGNMILRVRVPTTGYSAGEWIAATVNLDTAAASVDVLVVELVLKQKILLRDRQECETTRSFNEVVKKTENIGPFTEQAEFVLAMTVPDLPLSYLRHCNLIDINYVIKIVVRVSGCHANIQRKYAVIIGTKSAMVNSHEERTYSEDHLNNPSSVIIDQPIDYYSIPMPMPST